MTIYTKTLRWLSLLTTAFTIFVLLDWIIRLVLWFMRLPLTLLNWGTGPIDKIINSATVFLFDLNGSETLIVVITGFFTFHTLIYLLSILAPIKNKSFAKIISIILLTFLSIGLIAFFINEKATGENILWSIITAIGILTGWQSIKNESEKDRDKNEKMIQKNITRIFVSTLLFTTILVFLFFALF